MSVSLWRWSEACEGRACCGECDECGYEDNIITPMRYTDDKAEVRCATCRDYGLFSEGRCGLHGRYGRMVNAEDSCPWWRPVDWRERLGL